jgi:hypothetical protein
LALECRQFLLNICPDLLALDQGLNSLQDRLLISTNLLRRVAISEGIGFVLDTLEVDGDTKRSTQLVIYAEESSTRLETPKERSLSDMCRRRGLKLSWVERGTSRTLVGATVGGNERT